MGAHVALERTGPRRRMGAGMGGFQKVAGDLERVGAAGGPQGR